MYTDTIKIKDKKNTKFVAHRGVSELEPENTMASFLAACNRTYYGIETDIWHTADGQYICNHDGRTGRICDVDLIIEQSDYDTLRKLKLKDKDGLTDRNDLVIADAYEYKKICKKYGLVAVPELKSNFTESEIADLLEIFGDYLDKTCFIAFNIENLHLVKKLRPEQECQLLSGKWDDNYPEMLSSLGIGLDLVGCDITKERVQACHDRGVVVNCFTIDDPAYAERLIEIGVDQITTNILE